METDWTSCYWTCCSSSATSCTLSMSQTAEISSTLYWHLSVIPVPLWEASCLWSFLIFAFFGTRCTSSCPSWPLRPVHLGSVSDLVWASLAFSCLMSFWMENQPEIWNFGPLYFFIFSGPSCDFRLTLVKLWPEYSFASIRLSRLMATCYHWCGFGGTRSCSTACSHLSWATGFQTESYYCGFS